MSRVKRGVATKECGARYERSSDWRRGAQRPRPEASARHTFQGRSPPTRITFWRDTHDELALTASCRLSLATSRGRTEKM